FRQETPDILFLDVEMPYMSGFDFLHALGPVTASVIFTTAYDTYAIQAFKVNAVDYLLKPIDPGDLKEAIEKAMKITDQERVESMYKALIHNLQNGSKRIALSHQNGYDLVDIHDILWLEASVNYTTIHLKSGTRITIAKTLKVFEDYLDPSQFFRISRSAIVNLSCIVKFQKHNALHITLVDKSVLPVSETRKDELMALYQKI
ncbi:MAG TPA: LytTR family DNA-binding domain-containing protein, partial [Saprospiraceae bacterium]|nr:LytTR family DNA-binding domain-containing protein [Saprospiraceae bacterium]